MGRTRRRTTLASFVAGLLALIACTLGILGNVAASLVPARWAADHAEVVWTVTGLLVVLAVAFGIMAARLDADPEPTTSNAATAAGVSAVAVGQTTGATVIAPNATFNLGAPAGERRDDVGGNVIVGELPSAPPAFVDRAALTQLDEALRTQRLAVVCALTGGRGVGKTQVAAAFARRRAEEGCPLVAWVSGASADALLAGLSDVARALGVADEDGDSERSARNLRNALEVRRDHALLVVDNATDADTVRPYLPAVGMTHVVVTSTERAFTSLGTPVDVGVFTRDESRGYLVARTGRPVDAAADAVRVALGDLPLALAQAVAVMQLQHLSYAEYLDRLERSPVARTLARHPGDPYPVGTAEAILLSLDAVESSDRSGWVRPILETVAFLSSDGVDRSLLFELVAPDGEPADRQTFDAAVGHLVAMSVLTWGAQGSSVLAHRLVSRVLRERLDETGRFREQFYDVAHGLHLHEVPPAEAWARRGESARIVPQSIAFWDAAVTAFDAGVLAPDDIARVGTHLRWALVHLIEVADLSRAQLLGERLTGDFERMLGPEHVATLTAYDGLASAYNAAARFDEAIGVFTMVAERTARAFGTEHENALGARNNLAYALQAADRHGDALPLLQENLVVCERLFGSNDVRTLTAKSNLATAYGHTERSAEAIDLCEDVIAGRERLLGADHPATLFSRENLAGAYLIAGQIDDATVLGERNVRDRVRLLGTDHPDTLVSKHNLAGAYEAAGRFRDALALLKDVLRERERVLGPEHQDTLQTRLVMAGVYRAAGQHRDAITLVEATVRDCTRVFGERHQHTLTARNNLASAYYSLGRVDDAVALYEENLPHILRRYGADHRNAVVARKNLAAAYRNAGRHADAEALSEG